MKIKILSERENPLLERKEIKFEVSFTGGIKSRREIRKEIISTLKSKEELTILNGLKTQFGEKRAEGYVKVYKNKKALEVEPTFRLDKNFKEEEKKEPPVGEKAEKHGEEVEEPKKPAKEKTEEEKKAEEKPSEEKEVKEEKPESQEKEVKKEEKKLEEPAKEKEEVEKVKETSKPVKEEGKDEKPQEEPKPKEKEGEKKGSEMKNG